MEEGLGELNLFATYFEGKNVSNSTISDDFNINLNFSVTNSTIKERVKIPYPRSATVFAAVAAIIFIIVGVLGNLITILSLYRSRKLRLNATTWFILSLCFSDLLFCTINLPLTVSRYIHEEWILGETLCWLFPFFFYGNVATSLMSLVFITLNRYILISHYSKYDAIFKPSYIMGMILFTWIFSFSMLIPPLLELWGKFGLDPSSFSCTILKKDNNSPKKYLFVFGILLPCLAIIFCYTCIFFKVRQSRKKLLGHRSIPNMVNSTVQKRDDIRLTKMMLLIFVCFLVCFLPLLIFNVVDDQVNLPTLHVLASVLAWASAVINPFIYAFSNRQYRQAYTDLFNSILGRARKDSVAQNISRSGSGKTFITEMMQIQVNPSARDNNKLSRNSLNSKDNGVELLT